MVHCNLAAYLFHESGPFACTSSLFSLRPGSDRNLPTMLVCIRNRSADHLGVRPCFALAWCIPQMLGFFGKIYLFLRRLG